MVFAQCHITKAKDTLLEWEKSHPPFSLIISPLRNWLASQTLLTLSRDQQLGSSEFGPDQVIDALLKSIQSILSAIPAEDQFLIPSQDNYIKDTSSSLIRIGDLLRVDSKVALINSLVERLAGCPPEEIKKSISRPLPFIQRYTLLVEEQLACTARWLNSLFKLQLAACSVLLNIAINGFCKPPDSEEPGDGNTEAESGDGGVGFGEGDGNENVSKGVEDESQVEGLREESGESDRRKDEGKENDDDAIEISDDFQGELEDIPERGSEDEQSPGEDEASPDETLGDLDLGDPDTVDEKLWGDDGNQNKESEDHSTKPSAGSEVVAKEDEHPSLEKKRDELETGDEDNKTESKGVEVDEDKEEDTPRDNGTALDDFLQNSDTLDLPDGLELDEDPMQQDVGDEVDDEVDDDIGDGDLTAESPKGDDGMQLEPSQEKSPQPGDEKTNGEGLDGQSHEADEMDTEPQDVIPEDDVIMQPDVQAGDDTGKEIAPDGSSSSNAHEDPSESASGGTRGANPTSKSAESKGNSESVHSHFWSSDPSSDLCVSAVRDDHVESDTGDGGGANVDAKAGTMPSHESVPQYVPHDHPRRLGDAFKDTIRHSDDILEGDHAPAEQATTDPETSQLQYLHEDDADHNMQALGPAGAEEVAKLRELRLIDDIDGPNDVNQMDVDHEEHQNSQLGFLPPPLPPSEFPEPAHQQDIPGAFPRNEVQSQRPSYGADIPPERNTQNIAPDDDVPQAEYVELALRQWQANGQPSEDAQNLWRLYKSLTQDLSYALCEQLRLILEPTLATRLKGDYRSGKRLNMKKIIPYIASEYTKDKIWLRRTRPSQREYQVFLVLDDSRSMAESHSIHLAYETLALVFRALSRLEVGEIGIAKFGETVDVLHGFDSGPLTDQAATQVMSAFTFNQKATNVLALVETSLGILGAARESRAANSSSAGDLWQLEIVISDGLCQNHEELRAALRRAHEQRVMMVFVIIDSLNSNTAAKLEGNATDTSQNSILSMQQVAYKNVDGRMELQMQRYLDTFPFDYYVVLRDVEALPEVLSGTVKQFFERISDV